MAAMVQCRGTLLIHADGTAAACTEELEGRCCAGELCVHEVTMTCEDFLGRGGCEVCELEAFTARDWRHAVHVAAYARTNNRCLGHGRARQIRVAATVEPDGQLLAALEGLLRTP